MDQAEKERNYVVAEQLLSEQDFPRAVFYGISATAAGIAAWGVIAASSTSIFSIMAVALGAMIGIAVRIGGNGIDSKFAVLAGLLAFVGCILGNLAGAMLYYSKVSGNPMSRLIADLELGPVLEFLIADAQFVDLIFWIFAIGSAVYFAKRPLTREQGLAIYTLRRRPDFRSTDDDH